MRDAPATWALIVGIDTYDHVKHLTGAARDAAAAARWLIDLGVPPAQILLHAAPSGATAAEVAAVGLPLGGCREWEIWDSFETLMHNRGRRLFVFLCGHGFFEPGGDRVFLTREASRDVMKNLGIDWYAAFLRGLPYERQFLIMDGCLNLPYSQSQRARFKAGAPGGVEPGPPRPEVVQHFCYGASQGQTASEDQGRGIFLKTLLETLDLAHPHPDCVDVDDGEGTVLLDLERAVRDVCAGTVASIAAGLGRIQQPGIQMLSMGPTPRTLPVVALASAGVANVRVTVDPPGAADQVARLQLWSDRNVFLRRLPQPPDVKVTVPYASRLPRGLPVAVRCTVEPDGEWAQPPQQEFVADQDRDVIFRLERPSPVAEYVVRTIGPEGDGVPAMSRIVYDRIDELIADTGSDIEIERHATGPLLRSLHVVGPEMLDIAMNIASMVDEHTPQEVSVVVTGSSEPTFAGGAAVELPMTRADALRLGGMLEDEPVVGVGERWVSLGQLVEHPRVAAEPGPVTIRVALPWGEWHTRVVVEEAAPVRVVLPKEVGVPPLRTRVRGVRPSPPRSPPFGVLTLGERARDGTILDPAGAVIGRLKATSARVFEARAGSARLPRWRAHAALGDLRFPLNADGAVVIELAGEPRAEPLSWIRQPIWDRLVSSGRLENLSEEQASLLTYGKWASALLGLAGAYACFAHGRDDLLPVVLRNLAFLDCELPDVAILEAAFDRRRAVRRDATAARLDALGAPAAVPVFRWGVGIGVLAAEYYGRTDLAAGYAELEPRVVAGSVWTLWRE